jgi:pseudoazurin
MLRVVKLVLPATMAAAFGVSAWAADHEVKMLNKGTGGAMVFEPMLVKAEPGDTVSFVVVDKGHNAETVKDLIPEGAEPFKGKINEAVKMTVTAPGAYLIKCTPHFSMGMVSLIVVGPGPSNLDKIKSAKMPKKAKERVEAALAGL